ncbi:DUF58 domain-containing protein [Qingshengfaniella alkalisoli]|uniref:DUF58 domain-containing protein n=1 Tax=Qingshengfaniella alkalisoli TaxID=2599296 RepID=A0A5B8IUD1_9RHOB|nr:DUF58 domain-containing protein [Qingshengfaniella alkalisoli]QDY69722.1 DUF58 domain-containing protein [Qingshengfaniella alkalisoli]
MSDIAHIRAGAEALAAPMPPLLAEAEHLASTMQLGEHGRRRPGMGSEFWQFRAAQPHDEVRDIDWRRSARSDAHFIRQKEWQAAQTVLVWVDGASSMSFASRGVPSKCDRANVLALATSILLLRGGERVGLSGPLAPPRRGEAQIGRMLQALSVPHTADEYGAPEVSGCPSHARALFVSDFLGDIGPIEAAMAEAVDRGMRGTLLQVLDPEEIAFPFRGRTIFESMAGALRYETKQAGALRDRYLSRLAERRARLSDLAKLSGWHYHCHDTKDGAQAALLWVYAALEPVR